MICNGTYKDRPAVIAECGCLTAVFLPEDGGKMASLRVRNSGKELLAVKNNPSYKVLSYDGIYIDSECSGFDDMFPTVDPYTPVEGSLAGIPYPDHGECCRLPYTTEIAEDRVTLKTVSACFPITYEKTVIPTEDGGMDIVYTVRNNSDSPFPYLWAGHIMLQGEDGIRVFTPFAEDTPTEIMFATTGADRETLPKDRLMGYEPGVGAAYKFYYLAPMQEGRFGLVYPAGSRLTFTLDEQKLPYLGLWFNNGEFQDLYSITPEPCTVPFDAPDRAAKRGLTSIIPPKDIFTFTLHIAWED